jgi:hypothetical protein
LAGPFNRVAFSNGLKLSYFNRVAFSRGLLTIPTNMKYEKTQGGCSSWLGRWIFQGDFSRVAFEGGFSKAVINWVALCRGL